MESPVLLSFTPSLERDAAERICHIFFERLNVAGFSLLERPMAQFYAAVPAGSDLSGVVVDIGQHHTDITPIHDGFIVQNAPATLAYGIADCEQYLAQLFLANQGVVAALSPPEAPLSGDALREALVELARHVWQEGLVKVLAEGEAADIEEEGVTDIAAVLVAGKEKVVIESGMKKRANAKASAAEQARAKEIEALDLVTVQFRDISITLGKERHRFCEPLFDPALLNTIPGWTKNVDESEIRPLAHAVGHAVSLAEVDARQYIWQGLFVTGDLTNHIKGAHTFYKRSHFWLMLISCRLGECPADSTFSIHPRHPGSEQRAATKKHPRTQSTGLLCRISGKGRRPCLVPGRKHRSKGEYITASHEQPVDGHARPDYLQRF